MNKNYVSSTLQTNIINAYNDMINRSEFSQNVRNELQKHDVYTIDQLDEQLPHTTERVISIHQLSSSDLEIVIENCYTQLTIAKSILDLHDVPERYEIKRILRKIEQLQSEIDTKFQK